VVAALGRPRINIGSRHVLPIYIGLTILAASFAVDCLRRWRSHRTVALAVVALLVWLVVSVGLSHPDYLPYFNAIAGRAPEQILVDSDLDWGQDLKRSAKRLREVGAREVTGAPPGSAVARDISQLVVEKLGLPPVREFDPEKPSPGWNAISLTTLKLRTGPHGRPDGALWRRSSSPQSGSERGFSCTTFRPLKESSDSEGAGHRGLHDRGAGAA
jgi:hypothetical protein